MGTYSRAARYRFGAHPIAHLAWDRGSSRLALAQRRGRRGAPEHLVHLVDPPRREVRPVFAFRHAVSCAGCAFLADGRLAYVVTELLAHSSAHAVVLEAFDPSDGATERVLGDERSHVLDRRMLAVARAASMVAVATSRGAAVLEAAPRGEPFRERGCHGGPIDGYPFVALSPDGNALAWVDDAYLPVRVIDAATGCEAWSRDPFEGHRGPRGLLDVRIDARHLFTLTRTSLRGDPAAPDTRRVRAYDVATGQPACPDLPARTEGATAMALAARESVLAVGDASGAVRVMAPDDPTRGNSFQAFESAEVTSLAFDPSTQQIAVGSAKGELAVFHLPA